MPPKKKDEKKKDEKAGDLDPNDEERELVEKELVIGYLKTKLGRYQEHGDKLVVDNIKLSEALETEKLNLRDINEFLTNELKARSLTTSALEGKVQELNALLEEVKQNHEDALRRLTNNKDHEISDLQETVKDFKGRARTYQEFLDRKEQLEAELQQTKDLLARRIKEWEQKQTDIDRQHIQDREKWKRETAQRIRETKLQMMKLTDNQLEMTTKRTIMENEQMSIELSYQSRQTEKLLHKNTELVEENADLRRQLELSKQTESELAKRNNVYQKTIKSLLTKLKDQGWAQQEHSELVVELEQQVADLDAQLHLAALQAEERELDMMQLQAKLEEKVSEMHQLHSSSGEAARFLVQCIADVKDSSLTAEAADAGTDPGRLDELGRQQREQVLTWLLNKLRGYTDEAGVSTASPLLTAAMSHGAHHTRSASHTSLHHGDDPAAVSLPPITANNNSPAMAGRRKTGTIGVASPLSQSMQSPTWGSRQDASPRTAGSTALHESAESLRGDGGATCVTAGLEGAAYGFGMGGLPTIDDLLSKVMSDVRPWGKRSGELPLSSTKGGTFLKKGLTGRS